MKHTIPGMKLTLKEEEDGHPGLAYVSPVHLLSPASASCLGQHVWDVWPGHVSKAAATLTSKDQGTEWFFLCKFQWVSCHFHLRLLFPRCLVMGWAPEGNTPLQWGPIWLCQRNPSSCWLYERPPSSEIAVLGTMTPGKGLAGHKAVQWGRRSGTSALDSSDVTNTSPENWPLTHTTPFLSIKLQEKPAILLTQRVLNTTVRALDDVLRFGTSLWTFQCLDTPLSGTENSL